MLLNEQVSLRLRKHAFVGDVGFLGQLGKEAEGMKFPPLPNELGKRIFENVSQEAWNAWTRHQTMLINENRLSLADPRAREYLAQQMEQYFFGDGADAVQGYVPQEPK
mgnify:CR=1 FL=1